MRVKNKENLTELDKKIIRLAREGDIKGFVVAMMEHPVDGRLMRTFALEQGAPEYAKAVERILMKFGASADPPDTQKDSKKDGRRDRHRVVGRNHSASRRLD